MQVPGSTPVTKDQGQRKYRRPNLEVQLTGVTAGWKAGDGTGGEGKDSPQPQAAVVVLTGRWSLPTQKTPARTGSMGRNGRSRYYLKYLEFKISVDFTLWNCIITFKLKKKNLWTSKRRKTGNSISKSGDQRKGLS